MSYICIYIVYIVILYGSIVKRVLHRQVNVNIYIYIYIHIYVVVVYSLYVLTIKPPFFKIECVEKQSNSLGQNNVKKIMKLSKIGFFYGMFYSWFFTIFRYKSQNLSFVWGAGYSS